MYSKRAIAASSMLDDMRPPIAALLIAAIALAVGCESSPTAVESDVRDLWAPERMLAIAPASGAGMDVLGMPAEILERLERRAGFWAVQGRRGSTELRLAAPEGRGGAGDVVLQFELGPQSLLQRPDGSYFERGDSVYITVEMVNDRFEFKFEPSGLRFDPRDPARLLISYEALEGDLNRDGQAKRQDDRLFEQDLGVWKQESSLEPWMRIRASRRGDENAIRASIMGFTGFCLAG